MRKFFIWILSGALLTGVLPVRLSFAQYLFMMEEDLTGQTAPDFTLNTTKETNVNFTRYRNGQNAVIFFWATWCPHCREQLKDLNVKRELLAKDNLKLVIVNLGESKKQVEKYLKKNNIDLDVFLDEKGDLESKYQIIGVPTFFFINEEGKVTAVSHSFPDDYQGFLKKI